MPRSRKPAPSLDRLKYLLGYNPETGVFIWKTRSARCILAGMPAGGVTRFGYVLIRVDKVAYPAHRLAWFIMTGAWPADEIDHKNGVRCDNRWANLREATSKQNRENREKAPNNTSGVRGVSWVRSRGVWLAQIKHHSRAMNLGRYGSLIDAVAARKRAERELFTHHREY